MQKLVWLIKMNLIAPKNHHSHHMHHLLDDNSLEASQVTYPDKWTRFWAFMIDNLLTGLAVNFLSYTGLIDRTIVLSIIGTLFYPFYKIILEGTQGQTIGKIMLNIKVVRENKGYTAMTIGDANNRFLLWWPIYIFSLLRPLLVEIAAPSSVLITSVFLVLFIGSGLLVIGSLLSIFSNEKGKTWHDKIGGSICVQADSL